MKMPDEIHADLMPSVDGGKTVEVMLHREVTHRCPPEGEGLMPCCGRSPFEVSRWDRMTLDPGLVTCERGISSVREQGETMDADARSEAIEVMAHRLCGIEGHRTRKNDPFCSTSRETVTLLLDVLLAPRTADCETCWGRVNDVAPGATCENPKCVGGRIEKGPIAYLADSLVQVGWLVPDGVGFNIYPTESRGMDWRCFAHGKRPDAAVPVYRLPDESPKGGA